MISAYCEVYGNTLKNKVIEYMISHKATGIAVGDMAKELKISRPKAYEIIEEYMKKGVVIKSRIVGRTQLYTLNMENPVVKIYLRNYDECVQMVIDEYSTKNKHVSNNISTGTVSTRNR